MASSNNTANTDVLSDIIALLKEHTGFLEADYKRTTILRRIKRRMYHHNLGWMDEYYDFLRHHPKEIAFLANYFSPDLTGILKDPESYQFLSDHVVPAIVDHTSDINIWVVGCSKGEEAYTMAILFQEYLMRSQQQKNIQIYATDLHKTVVECASIGFFPEKISDVVSKERLDVFFVRTDTGYQIKPEIRQMIQFQVCDPTKEQPYDNLDFISCRNLLATLEGAMQVKIIDLFQSVLKTDRYLFLGTSDHILESNLNFMVVDKAFKIYRSLKKRNRNLSLSSLAAPLQDEQKYFAEQQIELVKPVFTDHWPSDNYDQKISAAEGSPDAEMLSSLTDDLNNYFRSNFNAQLFIDKNLMLRKFSPGALSYVNIRNAEVGKSIFDLDTDLDIHSFADDIYNVLSNKEIVLKEVEFEQNRFYQVMIMPYIRQENRTIDGVIITFYDITNLKLMQRELNHNAQKLRQISANLDLFVYSAIHELTDPILNIELALNMLKSKIDAKDPDAKEFIKVIAAAVLNFKKILNDLSAMGKA